MAQGVWRMVYGVSRRFTPSMDCKMQINCCHLMYINSVLFFKHNNMKRNTFDFVIEIDIYSII